MFLTVSLLIVRLHCVRLCRKLRHKTSRRLPRSFAGRTLSGRGRGSAIFQRQTHTRTHVHAHMHTHMCTRIHAHTRAHTCTHTRAHICTHARMPTHAHTYMRAHTHMCMHMRKLKTSWVFCRLWITSKKRPLFSEFYTGL